MNTYRKARALFPVIMFFASVGGSAAAMAETPWSLEKDADGIKVYTRVVSSSALREFRGEVEVAASPERVVQVLKDADAFFRWMPDVVKSELLKSTETDQYHYLENAAPWPVSHRDGVYHFTYLRTPDAIAKVNVRVEAVPNYRPEHKGVVRVPRAVGAWTLVPTSKGTNVAYQMLAEPGGSIPSWLANKTVVDTPFKTLKGLRAYLQGSLREQK